MKLCVSVFVCGIIRVVMESFAIKVCLGHIFSLMSGVTSFYIARDLISISLI